MNKELFIEELSKLNITLSKKQLEQLDKYYELLISLKLPNNIKSTDIVELSIKRKK